MAATDAVAAIIATHNGCSRGYIVGAIASILGQGLRPAEILVIDDASTDGTAQLVAERFSNAVRVVGLPSNLGPSGARNHGVRLAKAPFVAFLDDDDEWLPSKLESQLGFIQQCGACMVFGRAQTIDGKGSVLSDRSPHHTEAASWPGILFWNPVHGPGSVLVRRETMLSVGGFPEGLRMGEDWVLWARLARHDRLAFSDAMVTRYRVHEQQAAAGRSMTWIRERTLEALSELVGESRPAQAALVLNAYAYGGALRSLLAGRLAEARRLAMTGNGKIDWQLMAGKTMVGGLGKIIPATSGLLCRWELRRLVRRFEELVR